MLHILHTAAILVTNLWPGSVVLLLIELISSIVISLSRLLPANDEGPPPANIFFLEPPLAMGGFIGRLCLKASGTIILPGIQLHSIRCKFLVGYKFRERLSLTAVSKSKASRPRQKVHPHVTKHYRPGIVPVPLSLLGSISVDDTAGNTATSVTGRPTVGKSTSPQVVLIFMYLMHADTKVKGQRS